jgi:hypothetical protein
MTLKNLVPLRRRSSLVSLLCVSSIASSRARSQAKQRRTPAESRAAQRAVLDGSAPAFTRPDAEVLLRALATDPH